LGLFICLMLSVQTVHAANTQYQSINLQSYFPTSASGVWYNYRHYGGDLYSTYGFYSTSPGLQGLYNSLFNLQKPGQLYNWIKAYNSNGQSFCVATYDNLFFGTDLSVTEVGDWLSSPTTSCTPSMALGYVNPATGQPAGLAWAAPGGLRTAPLDIADASPAPAETFNLGVAREVTYGGAYTNYGPSGYTAWNYTKVVEVLPTFTPAYGRSPSTGQWGPGLSQTYKNVIHIILYHGTTEPNTPTTTCYQNLDPNWSYSKYYYSLPGYNSYATEYYFAQGVGIIQETPLLYTENGSYWGIPNCSGMITQAAAPTDPNHTAAQQEWISYIDNP
jgi:hypothetical protein